MDDNVFTTRVDYVIATSSMKSAVATARVSCGNFNLDVLGESLDLAPSASGGIKHSHSKLGKIRHKDIVEVDENTLPAWVDGNNSQCKQCGIGVGGFHSFGGGGSCLGSEANIFSHQMNFIAYSFKCYNPLVVEIKSMTTHTSTPGDCDGQ